MHRNADRTAATEMQTRRQSWISRQYSKRSESRLKTREGLKSRGGMGGRGGKQTALECSFAMNRGGKQLVDNYFYVIAFQSSWI